MKHTLSPKQRYQTRPPEAGPGHRTNADRWGDIAATTLFQEACEVALCELVCRSGISNAMDAAAIAYRIEGARQVLTTLANLAEPDPGPRLAAKEKQLQ